MASRVDIRYVTFYTAGSAAPKVAPAEPFVKLTLPRAAKKKKLYVWIDPVATAGIVLAAVMFVMLIAGAVQLQNTRDQAAAMCSYVRILQQENEELQATYEAGYDLETVKENAIALGLVPKEDVQHVTMQVPIQEETEAPGVWERFYSFLTGLFA